MPLSRLSVASGSAASGVIAAMPRSLASLPAFSLKAPSLLTLRTTSASLGMWSATPAASAEAAVAAIAANIATAAVTAGRRNRVLNMQSPYG